MERMVSGLLAGQPNVHPSARARKGCNFRADRRKSTEELLR
jgi:hypothetical protein